jgi:hypothetical protein
MNRVLFLSLPSFLSSFSLLLYVLAHSCNCFFSETSSAVLYKYDVPYILFRKWSATTTTDLNRDNIKCLSLKQRMAIRRNRRVSHISPDASKLATRRNQQVNLTGTDASKMATRQNQQARHNRPDASKKIVMFDASKSNRRAKSRKGHKEVPSTDYCPCHLLRNARHSAVKVLRIVRARMARTFCLISRKASREDDRDHAHQKFAPARDSHQSEAVEDCIAFMNSSSRKYE